MWNIWGTKFTWGWIAGVGSNPTLNLFLWLNYDNTLISNLEKEFKKIEAGEYNDKKSDKILAIADEYFKIKDAKEKRKISNLIKKLNKASK